MNFLLKPISFLFIIFFTYFLKRVGLFRKEHAMIVLNVIMNVTLPAVAVAAFADFDRDFSLMLLVLLGLGVTLASFFLMYAITPKMEKSKRASYLIGVTGFNIACYGLPVINAFYGSVGTIICVLFDIGNCIMLASGNYAFTSYLLQTDGGGEKLRIRDMVKRFFSSVPTDVYLVLLFLSIFGISIPRVVGDFIAPLADANAFLSMFMLGLLFTLPRQRSDWKITWQILAFRFVFHGAIAALMFYILPFSLEIRRIVVLILLCPMGSMSPAFIEKCHGDGELASFTNSISTICSLILMSLFAGWIFR